MKAGMKRKEKKGNIQVIEEDDKKGMYVQE